MNAAPASFDPRPRVRGRVTLMECLALVAVLGILAAILTPTLSDGVKSTPRNVDGISLRTIGNAELVHEQNYPGALTSDAVPDIYAFAAQLARDGQLVEPKTWFSKFDEGFNLSSKFPSTIVDPAAAGAVAPINPKFQGTPLAFAVALFPKGTHVSTLPSTVPLAWTRGLQTDGTWRKDSPYGGVGGFVFFLGNNLTYFKGSTASNGGLTTLKGQSTTNILETLPPGTRISEFQGPPKTR